MIFQHFVLELKGVWIERSMDCLYDGLFYYLIIRNSILFIAVGLQSCSGNRFDIVSELG